LNLVRNNTLVAAEITLVDPSTLAKTENAPATDGGGSPAGQSGGSVLEGVGSMLGGLLGGKPKAKATPPAKQDEMALGDDEPINQVIFESEINRALKKLERDPPSLETLELPPPAGAIPIDQAGDAKRKPKKAAQTVEELREEIRQLEQRLKELDSKQ
jgi:hypothetical protein